MTMNGPLDELLNLFEDDAQFKDYSISLDAQKLANINDEDGKEIKKIDNKQKEETTGLSMLNENRTERKPVRSLISIDFGCSKENDDSNVRTKKTNNESSLLHSDDISSSEDEWNGNGQAIHLSDTGRSIKRQLKEARGDFSNFLPNRMMFIKGQKLSIQENRCALQRKAQQITRTIESAPKDALKVYDPFFGIRIRNPTLSSSAFELYCDGLKKIRLCQLNLFSQSNSKWISLAIIIKKTGCRKSANGHEYMIWIASDLTNSPNGNVKILVFGECIKKFWKLQPGNVIALVAPSFAEGNDKQATVKLTKCAQVLEMGFCPDFGYCKAVKKDGGLCQNVVNLSQCGRCVYHIQQAAQKFTANRGSCASLSIPNQKLPLRNSNSFSDGIITISRRNAKISTNTLSINESRKNFKQQQAACLLRSKSLKECEKMTLDAIIAKEAAIFGTRSASQTHGKILSEEKNNESFKEFLQNQDGNRNLTHLPVLGKGLNSGPVLLTSPRKICNKLNISENAKRKAIVTIMKKGGLIKADPNSINGKPKKRCLLFSTEHKEQLGMKKSKVNENANSKSEEVEEFLTGTIYTADEISALLEKRSNHEVDLHQEDAIREERYFHAMEKKEKLENYLTNIMEVKNCNVIMCIQCNYVSHKQSDLCKQLHHTVKQCKANKRFFRCKQCNRRTISYERLPTAFCARCGYNDFHRVAMKDEKRIKLAQENLLLCGEERKYVNC